MTSKSNNLLLGNVFHPTIFQHGERRKKYNRLCVLTQTGGWEVEHGWWKSLVVRADIYSRFLAGIHFQQTWL